MSKKQHNWMQSNPIGSLKSETGYTRKEKLTRLPQPRKQLFEDFRSGYISYPELKQELKLLNNETGD